MIGRYPRIDYGDLADAYRPYDDRFPAVAGRVVEIVAAGSADVEIEHVGSSAIPGCAGKGVIDLMVLYQPGGLSRATSALESSGFQRYVAPGAWGEERPVMVGSIGHDGTVFRIHAHVIAADDPEVVVQRRFRDRLRADSAMVREYERIKRAVLSAGVLDSGAYNSGKDAFIRSVITDPDE